MLFLALVVQLSYAQEKTISGTISDENGVPLPGVNVIVSGTNTGTQTDFDGKYTIATAVGSTITYSFVGYKTTEQAVGASNNISFAMASDVEAIEEVVIVAYGSEKASNVTSAISVVKSEAIEQIPNASLDQILQGQAAGLNIQTSSGQPGDSGTIILRGRSSINGNIEPLFIIDGVPVDRDNFRSLNSNDIASVSVLKDASASALYGSRAASGVIIITTKTGKKNSGTKVQYRSLYGQSNRLSPGFELMNSQQYLTYQRSRGINNFSDAEIAARARQTNTNWQDLFFRTGETVSHEMNVTTGGERSTNYTSAGFFEQDGITNRSNLKRFTLRNNSSVSSKNERFNATSNLTLGYSENDDPANAGSGSLNNPFINAYIGNPSLNAFNPDGTVDLFGDGTTGFSNSPILGLNQAAFNTDSTDELKMVGKLGASMKLVDNVTLGTSLGMDYTNTNRIRRIDPNSLRGLNNDTNNPPGAIVKGSQENNSFRDVRLNTNLFVTYKNTFKEIHSLEVSGFTEYFKRYLSNYGFEAFGLDPKLPFVSGGFTSGTVTEGPDGDQYNYIPTVTAGFTDFGLFSYFGVAKYDYDNKYGLQASLRRDGSFKFPDNIWGTFWSVSGKWNIHNESFMDNNTFFDQLKLRVSYGTSGNDDAGDNLQSEIFAAFDLLGTEPVDADGNGIGNYNGNNQGYGGTTGYWVTNLRNPDLKWETTKQANIGLDFLLWDTKISGSIDVYQKLTEDLFLSLPLSTISGFNTLATANVGNMENRGVELSLKYQILNSEKFKWSVNGNIAYNKNEITKLVGDGLIEQPDRIALSEGDPIGSFYAVPWAGVNPANGAPLYFDLDGNVTETYSADNRVILDKTRDPKYVGGFGTNFSYKNFSLTSLFSYAIGQYRNNGSLAVVEDPTLVTISNQSTSIIREWAQPGDLTDIPSPAFGSTRLLLTDRYIEDASFLRLRNVTVSYNFDKELLKRTNLFTGIRFYVQGQNLLTWTKWRGFDPESSLSSTFFEFPTPRTYTLGFDVNF